MRRGLVTLTVVCSLAGCDNRDNPVREAAVARAQARAVFMRDSIAAAYTAYREAEMRYWSPVPLDRPTITIFSPRPRAPGDSIPDLAIQAKNLGLAADSVAAASGVVIEMRSTASLRFGSPGVFVPQADLPAGTAGIVLSGPRKPLEIREGLPSVEGLVDAIMLMDSLHHSASGSVSAS
ncbi:MAG: hypothetical protein ACREL6_03820 [Gemmatimonadales bacterium]